MPLDSSLKGRVRIEFGQNNISKAKERNVYLKTDNVLAVLEFPILLDRIAQHNINMDLAGTPEKKVYLENIGVSAEEIINEKYKSIDERYAEGKDNPGTGYLLLRKAERGENGEITRTSINTPIQLRYLILKLEKQRLKEINQRLDKTKKITKEDIKIENQQWDNSFNTEEQQHTFLERVRKKQEEKITKLKTESNEKSFKKSIIEHQKKKEDKTSSRIKEILNR